MRTNLFRLMIIIFSLFLLSGCSTVQGNHNDSEKISIVTTNFVCYDFAGDYADVTMLLAPGEEPHSFDPTPADIIMIEECDVFLYVGGESDEWIRNILSSVDDESLRSVAFMDCVTLAEEEHKEGMAESHQHEHGESCEIDHNDENDISEGDKAHNEYDEHVWTSVSNAIVIAEKVEEVIIAADPDNENVYHENAQAFIDELVILDADYRDLALECERNWVLFGDRFPFLYMMREYGFDYYAAFPGCSSETEPNAATIAFLIDKGNDEDVGVVLKESLSNGNVASAIAGEIDAEVLTMYSCDNIPVDEFERGETYLTLMKYNLAVLEEALNSCR